MEATILAGIRTHLLCQLDPLRLDPHQPTQLPLFGDLFKAGVGTPQKCTGQPAGVRVTRTTFKL